MDGPGTEKLARALGMNSIYVPSARHPSSQRDFGVAVLSPWPLDDGRKVPLPHEHRFRKLRRAAVAATVRTPAGNLRAYSVHFETVYGLWSEGHRRDQARAVLADAATWPGPVVIAGDLNGRGPADEVAKAGFFWLTRTLDDRHLLRLRSRARSRAVCDGTSLSGARARRHRCERPPAGLGDRAAVRDFVSVGGTGHARSRQWPTCQAA